MTLPEVAPVTTLVVNVASGPSAASTAAEVTSLVVEAGVEGWSGCWDHRTSPVAGSATTADTWGPSALADSGPASADCRPPLVGREPVLGPGDSTGRALVTGLEATVGTLRAASRGGSMRATVMPAASVNTLIMASASTAAGRVRRTMTYHLARGRSRLGVNHPDRPGANQWTSMFSGARRAECSVPADGDVDVRQDVHEEPDNQPADDGVQDGTQRCAGLGPVQGAPVWTRRPGGRCHGTEAGHGHDLGLFPVAPAVVLWVRSCRGGRSGGWLGGRGRR